MKNMTIVLDPTQQVGSLIMLAVLFIYAVVMTIAFIRLNRQFDKKLKEAPTVLHELETYDGIDDLSIFEVARYILQLSCKMSSQRLQCLCYFLQVEVLKRYNKPLFKESFVRWRVGPVCPPFNSALIDSNKVMLTVNDITAKTCQTDRLTDIQKRIIQEQLNAWKDYDTVTLVTIAKERELMDRFNIGDVIDNESIIKYYNK